MIFINNIIDIITENVEKSKKDVTEGLKDIEEANRLHKSATKKMLKFNFFFKNFLGFAVVR